ncbi:MAG: serine/threonine-protein phosphatase, partial [Deltaproteobacteria bacterium]|nr:serine/threonine-protein phosphatase [Deltaproteobacteria bacterium]
MPKEPSDHDGEGDEDAEDQTDEDWHITLVMDIPDDLAGSEGPQTSTFETHSSDDGLLRLSIEETGYQEPAATARGIVADAGAELPHPKLSKDAHIVVAAKRSDIGRRRKNNQDSFLVLEDEHVFIVADGMGGYAGGEIASKIAVETIQEAFRDSRFDAHVDASLPQPAKELAQAMQAANLAIWAAAADDPTLEGMGTTLVGARFSLRQRRGYIGHVGDSRCYRLRDDSLEQLTTDHTLGVLGVTGRDAVKLYRAVGIIPEVAMDIVMFVPSDGDTYLLCSD